jgi:predicted nucleotide-binding protein
MADSPTLCHSAGFGSAAPAPQPATQHNTYAEDRRKVMVVHGRNGAARDAMFTFLRSLDLHPLEWSELVAGAASASPYIGQVLDDAFAQAQAVVVLSTPDELARLHPAFVHVPDHEGEGEAQGQARPNVFFEAGMAFGRFPTRTIITELGRMRPASDLAGRHAVRLNSGVECRKDLAQRLEKAGCEINTDGTDWLSAGDFDGSLAAPAPIEDESPADTRDPASVALLKRVDALRGDLESGEGEAFVPWGVAQIYNTLLEESSASDLPRAELRSQTRADQMGNRLPRAAMLASEMRTCLGQLRVRLE